MQQWVIDGYTLMFASLLLFAGNLSEHIGARRAAPSSWPGSSRASPRPRWGWTGCEPGATRSSPSEPAARGAARGSFDITASGDTRTLTLMIALDPPA
jgi:hypothetical protein